MKSARFLVLISIVLLVSSFNIYAFPIRDTGQSKFYNNTSEIPRPAPGGAFYGQDGNYNINPPSYIKLDASGKGMTDDAASWAMVRDNVTGLIWRKARPKTTPVHDIARYAITDLDNHAVAVLLPVIGSQPSTESAEYA